MYVGIDLGLKHVGLAISKSHCIVSPYKNLYIEQDLFQELLIELRKLDRIMPLEKVFIGLPLHMDGNESPLSIYFRNIKKQLEKEFENCQFFLIDERLTTKSSKKKKLKNVRNDSIVAAELLDYQISMLINKNKK